MTSLASADLPTRAELAQVKRLLDVMPGEWLWHLSSPAPDSPWLLIDMKIVMPVARDLIEAWGEEPKFALWRRTLDIFRVGADSAVEEDPYLRAEGHPLTPHIRRLADDLDRYRDLPADHSEMERAVGVELRAVAEEIIETEGPK